MSYIRLAFKQCRVANQTDLQKVISARTISQNFIQHQNLQETSIARTAHYDEKLLAPTYDRSVKIPVELSIKYLQSDAYKYTYGNNPVWLRYRRNFKGQFAPKKTRKTCIRNQMITTSNACPICRDEYLILDHRNIALLKQFLSPLNGEIIDYRKTGLCQLQHKKLLCALFNARDYGTITFDPPFMLYDYSEWYNEVCKEHN